MYGDRRFRPAAKERRNLGESDGTESLRQACLGLALFRSPGHLYQTFGNLAIEFWPETRRKVFRAESKNQGGKKS